MADTQTQTQTKIKQRAVRMREIEVNGIRAWEYSDGSVRGEAGRPVPGTKIPNDGHEITHANARDMLARRRVVGLRSQLRGLAKGVGLDPSEVDDELLIQSGDALEAITAHMAGTFQSSKSLRGMAEAYNTLASPLVGDKRQRDEGDMPSEQPAIYVTLAQYISLSIQGEPSRSVIEGLVTERDNSVSNNFRVGEHENGNTDGSPTGQDEQP